MVNELNLYRVAIHSAPPGGKKRQTSDARRHVGAAADEAIRKTLAHVERFDCPPRGWMTRTLMAQR